MRWVGLAIVSVLVGCVVSAATLLSSGPLGGDGGMLPGNRDTYTGDQYDPAIYGDIVVWRDDRGTDYDIYGSRLRSYTYLPLST